MIFFKRRFKFHTDDELEEMFDNYKGRFTYCLTEGLISLSDGHRKMMDELDQEIRFRARKVARAKRREERAKNRLPVALMG